MTAQIKHPDHECPSSIADRRIRRITATNAGWQFVFMAVIGTNK
jgi:hypothetical protein